MSASRNEPTIWSPTSRGFSLERWRSCGYRAFASESSSSTTVAAEGVARSAAAMRLASARYDGSASTRSTAGPSPRITSAAGSPRTVRLSLIGVECDAGPDPLDGCCVRPLVDAEERYDDEWHPVTQRAEGRAVSAVRDDHRGVRRDRILRNPTLDVNVPWQRAELVGITRLAERHEHPRVEWLQRLDRAGIELRVVRQVLGGGHRAERDVDERPVLVLTTSPRAGGDGPVAAAPGEKRRGGAAIAGS